MSEDRKAGAIAVARWNREECTLIRKLVKPALSPDELDQVAIFCNHSGLEILIDQVYLSRFGDKLNIEPTIEGYRAIAARYDTYAGSGNPEWFDQDGEIYSVWLKNEHPAGARIEIYRYGDDRPTVGVARYESYVQKDGNGRLRGNWGSMPEVMLAAAAERQALSKAFPLQHVPRRQQDTSDPTDEGMEG
jgi:phage recombination protein Bet